MNDYAVERTLRIEKDGVHPYMGWKERSMVSVSENGKTYKTNVAEGLKSAVFQVD